MYVATIGFFDGVHIGHQKLISFTVEVAKLNKYKSLIYTFDKVAKIKKNFISTLKEKLKLLKSIPVDKIDVLEFDKIKNLTPEEFFTHFITNKRISIIIAGEDFRFGRSGCGDVNLLIKLGVRCRVSVIIVEDFKIRIDEKVYSVSSSLIREKIINGEFDKLNVLLGRRYSITGKIVKGQGIGHKIGVPTINFATDAELVMPYGVIAGFCKLNKTLYPSVANFGYRPTLDGKEFVPEIHILDKKIKKIKSNLLEFIPILKIREEKKFNSLIELKKQIQEDIKIAKKYLC